MGIELPPAFLVVVGVFFVFAILGFVGSCAYQWRRRRARRRFFRDMGSGR